MSLQVRFSFLRGKTVEEATEDVLQVQLPHLKALVSAGKLRVDNIDVFCEQGVFDLDSTRFILQAGKEMGLHINFHGDELHPMSSAEVRLSSSAAISVETMPRWLPRLVELKADMSETCLELLS